MNAEQHLDLLLLTQGWRNYTYLHNPDSLTMPVSKNHISGHIERLKYAKGMVHTKGSISLFYCGNTSKIETDKQGNFSFNPIFEKGYNPNLFLTAIDNQGKSNVELKLDPNEFQLGILDYMKTRMDSLNLIRTAPIYTINSMYSIASLSSVNEFWIEEVTVKARNRKKAEEDFLTQVEKLKGVTKIPEGTIKSSEDILEIMYKMGISLIIEPRANCDGTFIPKIYNPGAYPFSMMNYIINSLNCRECKYNLIRDIKPEDIKEMYLGVGDDVWYFSGGYCTIFIFLKNPDICPIYNNRTPSTSLITFNPVKEFYSPKYSTNKERNNPNSDYRKTIYWNPAISTNKNGEAIIKFYNADQRAKIKYVIEGFGENKLPVYGDNRFEVDEGKLY